MGRGPLEGLRGHRWEMALFHFLNFLLPLSPQAMQKSMEGAICAAASSSVWTTGFMSIATKPGHPGCIRTPLHACPLGGTAMSRAAPVREMPVTLCARGTVPTPVCFPHPGPRFPDPPPHLSPDLPPPGAPSSLHRPHGSAPAQPPLESAEVPGPLPPLPHPVSAKTSSSVSASCPAPSCPFLVRLPRTPLSALSRPGWSLRKLIPQFPPHLPEACLSALLCHLKPLELQRNQQEKGQ